MNEIGASSAATQAAAHAPVRRHGSIEVGSRTGLFGLLLRNLMLSVLTLMIYRFWARTALRRFLWSRIRIDGDPLEYTGRGSELFVGFLIAMAFLAPVLGAFALVETFLEPGSATFFLEKAVYVLVIFVLIAIAQFRARRYRLSRTMWRGIAFAQTGSQWAYLRLTLGWGLLTILSLGIVYPRMRWAQTRYLVNNTWFGDKAFEFPPFARPPMLPWLVVLVVAAVPAALLAFTLVGATMLLDYGVRIDAVTYDRLETAAFWSLVAAGPLLAVAYVHFRIREFRAVAATTLLGFTSFRSGARTRSILGQFLLYTLAVGALAAVGVAMIATLVMLHVVDGFGADIARNPAAIGALVAFGLALYATIGIMWTWVFVFGVVRHLCSTLTVDNLDALGAIGQSTRAGPRAGEGLADSFDVGV